jgi:hypothetical protein
VDVTELGLGGSKKRLNGVDRRDISRYSDGSGSGLDQSGRGRRQRVFLDVSENDTHAFGSQPLGDSPTDAARRTGYDGGTPP